MKKYFLSVICLASLLIPSYAVGATWCVDDSADPGGGNAADCAATCDGTNDCALRDAVLAAGNNDTIIFAVGLGTINTTASIGITESGLTINGDRDGNGIPDAVINGNSQINIGLNISGANNIIRGLALQDFYAAVVISGAGATGNRVQGCYIGTNSVGTVAVANTYGVSIGTGASSNIIGVDGNGVNDSTESNLISGNANEGVRIADLGTNNNWVAGNTMGLNATATAALANGAGVAILDGAAFNIIGTNGDGISDAAERNFISGNTQYGVVIYNPGTTGNRVVGNYVGINPAGNTAFANGIAGVGLGLGAASNIVGTNGDGVSDDLEINVVSGNSGGYGILLTDAGTSNNRVAGNHVGVNPAGTAAIPNLTGIRVQSSAGVNIIGTNGDGVGDQRERNIVSGNTSIGINLTGAGTSGNRIAGNWVGVDITGNVAIPNGVGGGGSGIYVSTGANGNIIGTNGDGVADTDEGNTVSGNNPFGVFLSGVSGTRVTRNKIGLNDAGTAAVPNVDSGVLIAGAATGNTIGTNSDGAGDAVEGNVISGNTVAGVTITGAGTNNNIVASNSIGTNQVGTAAIGNGIGVLLTAGASNNVIGTDGNGGASDQRERNIISGNVNAGILIRDAATTGNRVASNFIGPNLEGTVALGNGVVAVSLELSTSANIIGTNGDGVSDHFETNIISGNTVGTAVSIVTAAFGNTVAGNFIGLREDATTAMANANGIVVNGGPSNTIGGDIAAEENLIRFNGGAPNTWGVNIGGATGNALLRNRIYDNPSSDFVSGNGGPGVTAIPTNLAGAAGASSGRITVNMNATAGHTLHVYKDGDKDARCEAMEFLGMATDNGNGTFTVNTSNLNVNDRIAVTAKDAVNNTSNFACYTVADLAPVLASVGSKGVSKNTGLAFTLTGFEPNAGETTTYACTNDNAAAVSVNVCQYLNATTGAFSWTPSYAQVGTYLITLRAVDASDSSLVTAEQITLTVTNPNTTPTLTSPGDKTVAEGSAFSFTLSATDTDGDPVTYSCATNCPLGFSVNASTGAVSWTPSQAGTYAGVTLKVSDPAGNSSTQSILIAVTKTASTNTADATDGAAQSSSPSSVLTAKDCAVVAANFVTGEECGISALNEDGSFEVDCDPEKMIDPEDGVAVRMVFSVYCGEESAQAALSLKGMEDRSNLTVVVEKYYEATEEELALGFSIGQADISETFSVQMLREEMKEKGADVIRAGSFRPGCYQSFASDLFQGAGEGKGEFSEGIEALREVVNCLMASRVKASDLGNFENYAGLVSDFMSGRIAQDSIDLMVAKASVLCGMEEVTRRERLKMIGATLPRVRELAANHIASDETSCEKVKSDPVERSAWVNVVQSLDEERLKDRTTSTEMGDVLGKMMEQARVQEDYTSLADPTRAKIMVGVFQTTDLVGKTAEAIQATMEMVKNIQTEDLKSTDLKILGETVSRVVAQTAPGQLEDLKKKAGLYGNYIRDSYMTGQFTDPKVMASSFNQVPNQLQGEARSLEDCLQRSRGGSGGKSSTGCFQNHTFTQAFASSGRVEFEVCGDGTDNDGDGKADCSDTDCSKSPVCAKSMETCGNGIDDDRDGRIDCADTECATTNSCLTHLIKTESCDNGIDDDKDGQIDCGDNDCSGNPSCRSGSVTAEACANGLDDDRDGWIDCADSNCQGSLACAAAGFKTEICGNGIDDDQDGKIDCLDGDCAAVSFCFYLRSSVMEICANGIDDDRDGKTDCADSDCGTTLQCQKSQEVCGDGIDNDKDGKIDCADTLDCSYNSSCQSYYFND